MVFGMEISYAEQLIEIEKKKFLIEKILEMMLVILLQDIIGNVYALLAHGVKADLF